MSFSWLSPVLPLLLLLLSLGVPFGATGCASARRTGPAPAELPPVTSSGDLETVVLLGTNDIHGALTPNLLKTKEADPAQARPYEAGGLTVFATYLKTLRKQLGGRLVWLDAGDQWQGTLESNLGEGAAVVDAFNQLGLNAAAIGNHEFDFGPEGDFTQDDAGDPLGNLKARVRQARYPYLGANVASRDGRDPDLAGVAPSTILSVGDRLKLGVIGLSTEETPTTTRAKFVRDLRFQALAEATVAQARRLRERGAHLVVVTAHAGVRCARPVADPHAIHRPTDVQGACGDGDELPRLLAAIPAGTVDAVVSGHTHTLVHHWIHGVPVIQDGANARYFNLIYLTYDVRRGELLRDRTRIEGPIPVCARHFEHQGDCDGDRPAPVGGRGDLVEARFRGAKMGVDAELAALLAPALARTAERKARVVGSAELALEHTRAAESMLGNVVADAVREAAGTKLSFVNPGGIRAPIDAGPITFGQVFRSLPFDNFLATLRLTGRELKLLLRIIQSGHKGFFPTSGLRVRALDPAVPSPSDDLDGDGKPALWEMRRLLDARLEDGSPILDEAHYDVATVDFLVGGGDDLEWFMKQIPPARIRLDTGGLIRDALVSHLGRRSPINTRAEPAVDPATPRLKLEKSDGKTGTGKARTRRRRRS